MTEQLTADAAETVTFADLGLMPTLLRALDEAGHLVPTPIQARAVPAALAGRDLLASANTGTGKTAAFVLPALQRLREVPARFGLGPRILVLAPTRELATQILDAVRRYARYEPLRAGAILGGMPYRAQLQLLQRPVDLIVATPGRLIDHLERGRLDLSRVDLLVLDEADRMLDMGFIEPVERIAAACPAGRQTLLFTATVDAAAARLARRLLSDPERIDIAGSQISHDAIDQRLLRADDLAHKHRLLDHLVTESAPGKAIVFAGTKRDADRLAEELSAKGHLAAALHGDMHQGDRNRTIDALRRGRIRLLVATDVAARGIDVADVTHVINFDLPRVAEDYVHRIGRTGRAGASGIAYSMATGADWRLVKAIERLLGRPLSAEVIPGLEPSEAPRRPRRSGPHGHHKPSHGHAQGHGHGHGQGAPGAGRRRFGAAGGGGNGSGSAARPTGRREAGKGGWSGR